MISNGNIPTATFVTNYTDDEVNRTSTTKLRVRYILTEAVWEDPKPLRVMYIKRSLV